MGIILTQLTIGALSGREAKDRNVASPHFTTIIHFIHSLILTDGGLLAGCLQNDT
jgi:hypothetical protein